MFEFSWKMHGSAVVLLLMTAVVAFAVALPYAEDVRDEGFQVQVEEEVEESDILTSEEGETGVRARRATCDLLSFSTSFGSLNHSACALHCLSKRKGFKGGRCQKGVCHCRK